MIKDGKTKVINDCVTEVIKITFNFSIRYKIIRSNPDAQICKGACKIFNTSLILKLVVIFCFSSYASAFQSIITESEGMACMEKGRTKTQIEEAATDIARRNAIENAIQYLNGNSANGAAKEQLSSLQNATVKIINEIDRKWTDENEQECFSIAIQAEVIPEEKVAKRTMRGLNIVKKEAEPVQYSATLNIEVWSDKTEYKTGDEVTIFLKGNKSFYARVIYRDAGGNTVQLLPNPYRSDNYFEGNATYRIPSGLNSRFHLPLAKKK